MGWALLFLAGGIGGALCDQIHVQSGVLSYPHPFLAQQAWWVAPQFGVGMLVVVAAATPFARRAQGRSRTAVDAVVFLAAYGATGLFHRWPVGLTVVLPLIWLVRVAVDDDRGVLVVWSLLLALGGSLYEGTVAGTGAFHYTRPDLYHVPMWLPGIYLNGAALALDVGRTFLRTAAPRSRPTELSGRRSAVARHEQADSERPLGSEPM